MDQNLCRVMGVGLELRVHGAVKRSRVCSARSLFTESAQAPTVTDTDSCFFDPPRRLCVSVVAPILGGNLFQNHVGYGFQPGDFIAKQAMSGGDEV